MARSELSLFLGERSELQIAVEDRIWGDDRIAEALFGGPRLAALQVGQTKVVVDLFGVGVGGVTEDRHEVDLREVVLAHREVGGAPVVSSVENSGTSVSAVSKYASALSNSPMRR